MPRDDDAVADIVIAGRHIQRYISGVDGQKFADDEILQDAVIRRLLVIGEATTRISEEYRAAHAEIPWRQIAGMRNVLIHQYDRVDHEEVWRVASEELDLLLAQLESLLPPLPPAD